jgi:NCS2 family nucleobase:cation symporter-2
MGVLSKIAGIITSIPDPVLGGMTIFLFANVTVSGLALAAMLDLHSRRIKFIMAMSLAVGLGVTIWPYAFQDWFGSTYTANFWRCGDCSPGLKGVRNGVSIFLSTGYCVGTVIAIILNFALPKDAGVLMPGDDITKRTREDSDEDELEKPEAPSDPSDDSKPEMHEIDEGVGAEVVA